MPTELKQAPSMGPMMAKAALGMTPFGKGRPGRDIPATEFVLKDVKTDQHHLSDYNHVCEFSLRNTLPVTYPHMAAFPLQMAMITDDKFPYPAIGLVHIQNRIVQRRPIGVAEIYDVSVRCTPAQPHAKGKQFTFISEVSVGGEVIWEEFSTYLRRGGSGGGEASKNGAGVSKGEGEAKADKPEADLPVAAEWRLPSNLGRHYGSVSGDRNPIHMFALTAKALGFPRAIAHGMWTKARCMAALDAHALLPDAYTVEVRFQRPILLPAKVNFCLSEGDDGVEFAVRDARKGIPHLAGQTAPIG